MRKINNKKNWDEKTVEGFGNQWSVYDQKEAKDEEQQLLFDRYFSLMNLDDLPQDSCGFDMGCGTGRWAKIVSRQKNIKKIICIDPAEKAINVAKENLKESKNCEFINASSDGTGIGPGTMDFGYSLGVLHHVPDTQQAIEDCVRILKPGAPLLLYLYYKFENKPLWYLWTWKASELLRWFISKLPLYIRNLLCECIAILIYFPMAKSAWLLEKLNLDIKNIPLSDYRNTSLYRMRHNARDRFGTPLEKRFTREEIKKMLMHSNLENIKFRENEPFWCVVATKKH
jgi:ubiquinone/menaquinone biosynthesis C-methylase UbiE